MKLQECQVLLDSITCEIDEYLDKLEDVECVCSFLTEVTKNQSTERSLIILQLEFTKRLQANPIRKGNHKKMKLYTAES